MYRLRFLIIPLLLLSFHSNAQTAYCGPFTPHSNISESGHSFETIRGDSINCTSTYGIYLFNCHDIHITKCKFAGSAHVGIYILGGYNITIDSCFFSGTASGLYAQLCTGGIVFQNNHALNMQGPLPRGQMVQYSSCTGAGNVISHNISQGTPGANNYEDHINIYASSGTVVSPILIEYNSIYGESTSTTGSGITVADGSGGSYITVMYNTVVNCGSHGIQAAGGTYINISNNTIYSKETSTSILGLGYGNYSGNPSNNVTMGFNRIKWTNSSGHEADTSHHWEAGSAQVPVPAAWSTNYVNSAIDSTVLSFPLWASCVVPPNISYSPGSQSWTQYVAISTWSPTNTGGAATSWAISPTQPSGIIFNTGTGAITGTPYNVQSSTGYVVTATNGAGSSNTTIYITVTASSAGVIVVRGFTAHFE